MPSEPTANLPTTIVAHEGVPASGWLGRTLAPPLVSFAIHIGLVLLTAHSWLAASTTAPRQTLQVAAVEPQQLVEDEAPLVVATTTTNTTAAAGQSSPLDAPVQLATLTPIPAPTLPTRSPPQVQTPTAEIRSWVDGLTSDVASLGDGTGSGGNGLGGGRVGGGQDGKGEQSGEGERGAQGAEFFGVAAGGTRFVFVVDSSRSMSGRRWVLACQELLRTIQTLNEEQSFYVIFFDQGANPMFTKDVQQDLLPATKTNTTKLRRWISSISFGTDTRPAMALRMALTLKPDAIFLLSDGEFQDNTRSMLKVANRRRANDGHDADDQFVAPIHTIGFHSPASQLSLQPLAAENGGIYRFVPHPRAVPRGSRTRQTSPSSPTTAPPSNQLSQVQR